MKHHDVTMKRKPKRSKTTEHGGSRSRHYFIVERKLELTRIPCARDADKPFLCDIVFGVTTHMLYNCTVPPRKRQIPITSLQDEP